MSTKIIDGALNDWTSAERIDDGSQSGYQIYGTADSTDFIFAMVAPAEIGAFTTAWFNTDRNASTGYQVFGFAGGAEYNVDFAADGTLSLYSGAAGQTLVASNLTAAWSADRTIVEFRVSKATIGNPLAIDTIYDINDATYLPSNYSAAPFTVFNDTGIVPAADTRVAIVFSETTANNYFSETAYSQLFMSVQSQVMQSGIPFDILTEADLTSLSTLAQYDALIFPSFRNVEASQVSAITNTLQQATEQFGISLIAAGEFMTNDASNNALAGNSYARMALLFDATRTTGGDGADITIRATDPAGSMLDGYANGEVINQYSGVGWNTFSSVSGTGSIFATQTIDGQAYAAVLGTTTGARNVLFATESIMADANMLQQAVDYVVNDAGPSVGLQLSRQAGIVATRVDMDQSQERYEVDPEDGSPGIYDLLLPTLTEWKSTYNFVGSYYVNIGNQPSQDQETVWSVSLPYYKALIDLGNEIGTHSYTHPEDTNVLSASQLQFQFAQSAAVLQTQLSNYLGYQYNITGAAIPGAPETLATSLAIQPHVSSYLSGGWTGQGAGYPNAFGYMTPDTMDKIYLAPNALFDFTLFEWQQKTPAEADAAWAAEFARLTSHAETPIVLWPWHDYGVAMWDTERPSPYLTEVYTNYIARAAAADMEFATLDDVASRIRAYDGATITSSVSGNTITATVSGSNLGKFALDVDGQGTQLIKSVTNWYAYDQDSVFMPANGGTFTITLGAAQDDVTHITELPMRAELLSLTGDGTNLYFTAAGEGLVTIDIKNPGTNVLDVSGATIVSQVGEILTLNLGAFGTHNVSVTFNAAPVPVITSDGGGASANLSRAENLLAVTTVVASNNPTFAITGGADAALFSINATTGVLTFNAAPDFEAAADSDRNNVYLVTVRAANADGSDTQQLAVTVTNVVGATQTAPAGGGTLTGTNEEETLNGGAGNDTLHGLGNNDSLNGAGGADNLYGGDGNDTLSGGTGNDLLEGGAGTDTLNGQDGDDRIYGGDGVDTITGGIGLDLIDGGIGNDIVSGNDSNDTIYGGAGDDQLDGNNGADTIDGGAGNDWVMGGNGQDWLHGGAGDDYVWGWAGNDFLYGEDGNDTLVGDTYTDWMSGGAGADRFVFNAIAESPATSLRDEIVDFQPGVDKIDLSGIDANANKGGNQAFTFLPGTAIKANAQVTYQYQFINGVEYTVVSANVNANVAPDFQVQLLGHIVLSSSDFVL